MNHSRNNGHEGASSTRRNAVAPGSSVAIVLKADQHTGALTRGVVGSVLTNSSNHPRGIKVRLTSGQVGRVQQIFGCGDGDDGDATEVGGTPLHSPRDGDHTSHGRRRGRPSRDDGASPVGADGGPSSGRPSLADWFPATEDGVSGSAPEPAAGPSDATVTLTPWSCEACTYVNTNLELECEICLTERGGGGSGA